MGRLWKGDSSPSSLEKKKSSPAAPKGTRMVPVPQSFAFLPYSWPSISWMPSFHLPCPQRKLLHWPWGWCRWLLRKLATSQRAILVFTSLLFFLSVSGLPGVLLCGMLQILVLTAQPWHRSDLGKSSLPFFEPGYLPRCLTQYPFTSRKTSPLWLEDCLAWHLAVPDWKPGTYL